MYTLLNRNAKQLVLAIDQGFVDEYTWLVNNTKPPFTSDYKTTYRQFWRTNMGRLSDAFYKRYFAILARGIATPPDLEKVVASLYEASEKANGQKSIQFSFATKLLHMTDQHLPVFDSQVAEFYFFQPSSGEYDQRLAKLMEFYAFLRQEYARVLKDGLLNGSIGEFRTRFPKSKLTDEKVIDTLIWAFVKLLRQGTIQYS